MVAVLTGGTGTARAGKAIGIGTGLARPVHQLEASVGPATCTCCNVAGRAAGTALSTPGALSGAGSKGEALAAEGTARGGASAAVAGTGHAVGAVPVESSPTLCAGRRRTSASHAWKATRLAGGT